MKGRSSLPGERGPYSGRRPAGGEDALSVGREDCNRTLLGIRKSEVDQIGVMIQYDHTSQ